MPFYITVVSVCLIVKPSEYVPEVCCDRPSADPDRIPRGYSSGRRVVPGWHYQRFYALLDTPRRFLCVPGFPQSRDTRGGSVPVSPSAPTGQSHCSPCPRRTPTGRYPVGRSSGSHLNYIGHHVRRRVRILEKKDKLELKKYHAPSHHKSSASFCTYMGSPISKSISS